MLNKTLLKRCSVCLVFLGALAGVTLYNQKSLSASLTSVSATLSNSRPSFRGALTSTNTVGSSIVNINTTPAAYYSTNSAQLVEGDTVRIGESGSMGTHVVSSTPSNGQFTITSTLASGDTDTGDDVISSQSADITVRFTTANAINNGRFRILVPALADNGASSDGIPDGENFDFGRTDAGQSAVASSVTCPTATSAYSFTTGTASASAITLGANQYHAYECAYAGTGGVSSDFGSVLDPVVINDLINPAPAAGHTGGLADRYNVIVQHLDAASSIVDSTTVNIGIIEAVKITATVAPQITFRIDGVADSATACGLNLDVTTTPTLVPFGELLIGSFRSAAQTLVVSTNAANGYAVTAVANDQLGRNGGTCTGDPTTDGDCIPDSRGDTATMTHLLSDEWGSTTNKGFAYSLDNTNGIGAITTGSAAENFEYDSSNGACDGSGDCFRQFADAEDGQGPVRIMADAAPADNDNIQVCYKAIISAVQAAGAYENYVTYTATATF